MISTANVGKQGVLTPTEKTEIIGKIKQYHTPLLKEYNIPEKNFNVKLVFTDSNQKVVGIFPSEFMKEDGFYMEFVNSKLEPTDPKRQVYKLKYTPNHEDVYKLLPSGTYAVPIEELDVVNIPEKKPAIEFDYTKVNDKVNSGLGDDNISKMTIRDFAAIIWQKPVSEKPWLNELINHSEHIL